MQAILSDPLTLTVLLLIAAQSLIYLIGGINRQRQQRRGLISESARAETRLELIIWRVIPPGQHATAPEVHALTPRWLGILAWSRIGMGAAMLLAAGCVLLVLAWLNAGPPTISATPSSILAVTLLLQAYAIGMVAGAVLGLLIALPGAQPTPGARRADYRALQVVILPGMLLLIDVALVGGLDLLFLHQFTQAEPWSLAVFPGLLALVCILGEWFMRRLAHLPIHLTDDPALAARVANRFRARLVGKLLEREVFALFILVASQWFIQTFSSGHPSDLPYIAALPVYAVVLLSMRGLLEGTQQELGQARKAAQSVPAAQPEPDTEADMTI